MKELKIYTKLKRGKKETVEEFLYRVIFTQIVPGGMFKSVPTYRDAECTKVQCVTGRSRTLRDLYAIILVKFPNTTYKTFSKAVIAVVRKTNKTFLLCPHVGGEWVITAYGRLDDTTIGRLLATYRGGHRKLNLSNTSGYDVATVLKHAGFSKEQFPAKQVVDLNLIEERL